MTNSNKLLLQEVLFLFYLLVDVAAFNGLLGCLVAKANVSPVSHGTLDLATQSSGLLGKEDGGLLLESLFDLCGAFVSTSMLIKHQSEKTNIMIIRMTKFKVIKGN